MLFGTTEALLCSVIRPGLICVDYADYLNTFGDGPLLLKAAFATGDGPARGPNALATALGSLEQNGGLSEPIHSAMVATGLPENGAISEMEEVACRFAGRLPFRPMVSAPMAFGTSFEVALITATRVPS